MERTIVIGLILLLLPISILFAQEKNFGLGVILGEPTGISFKKWISKTSAIDGSVAWSFGKKDALHIHSDFLVHNYNLIRVSTGKLPIYYGIGGRLKLQDDIKLGIRIPIGLNYQFKDAPLDIFFELVPILELIPGTEFSLNAAVGIRFFF